MNALWQQLTLANLSLPRWRGGSYLYRLVGLLGRWRQGSWLLRWAEPLGAVLTSLVLVLAPFVSTTLVGVLLIACGGYWLLLTLADDRRQEGTPIHLLVALYWGIAAIATAFSPVKMAALPGFVELTLFLMLFLLAAKVLRSPRLRNAVLTVVLHISLLVASYGVRQEYFGVEPLATWNDPTSELAQDTRVYSFLGNPNLLAGYLLTGVALSIAACFIWHGRLPKVLAVGMVGINSACLFFTDSRGGWLGMLALIFALFIGLRYWWADSLPRFWRRWLLPLVFGAMGLAIVAAIALLEPIRLRVLSLFAGREDSSNNFRINVWEAVFAMIRDRPWLGIGPGNDAFEAVYPLYMRSGYTALSAYSVFLEHIVELGYIGFAAFLWLLATTLSQGCQQLARLRAAGDRQGFWLLAAIAACAGLLMHGMVDTVWYRPQVNTLWWLMVALIASFYPDSAASADQPPAVRSTADHFPEAGGTGV
ncbi:putative bicarbonate transporter, IctB family [bacterium]|nr:putative bicarbonate transporter, IctB family [bacterium]